MEIRKNSTTNNQTQEKAENGNHTVKGFTIMSKWMNEEGQIVPLPDNDGVTRIGISFARVDNGVSPVAKVDIPLYYAIALQFTQNAGLFSSVNYTNRELPENLAEAMRLANESDKAISVYSYNGWVNSFKYATAPIGLYDAKFVNFHRLDGWKDESLEWFVGQYGDFLVGEFEIVNNGRGNKCLWTGLRLINNFNRGWPELDPDTGGIWGTDDEGNVVNAYDLGHPIYAETLSHSHTSAAQKWHSFACAVGIIGDILRHEWAYDPEQSVVGVDEILSPQYVYDYYARQHKNEIFPIMLKEGKNGVTFSFEESYDLRKQNPDSYNNQESVETEKEDQVEAPEHPFSPLIDYIISINPDLLEVNLTEEPVSVVFTDSGKVWAKEHLGDSGIWESVDGLTLDDREIVKITRPQAEKLVSLLQAASQL